MTSNFTVLLKKYSVPAIFFVAGTAILAIGFAANQGPIFKLASVLMFVAGALSILLSSGKLNAKIMWIFGAAAGISAILTFWYSFEGVSDTMTYNENYKKSKALAKQNLTDIRFLQRTYVAENGKYMSTWEEVIDFAKNGTMPYIDAAGVVPARKLQPEENKHLYVGNPPIDNNMTEQEAYRLSKWTEGPYYYEFKNFKRDTIRRSILKYKFNNKTYLVSRTKAGFPSFNPDSLPFVPYTGARVKWNLETKDSVPVLDTKLPAIYVHGKIPFAASKGSNNDEEEMFFGSLSNDKTDGSWENE